MSANAPRPPASHRAATGWSRSSLYWYWYPAQRPYVPSQVTDEGRDFDFDSLFE